MKLVKKSLVKEIKKRKLEDVKESKFYMEMQDRIADWDYYNALSYVILLLENQDVSDWVLV